jgi:hypothetical protein
MFPEFAPTLCKLVLPPPPTIFLFLPPKIENPKTIKEKGNGKMLPSKT